MNQSVVEGGEEVHGRPKLSLQKRSDALQSAPALAPTSTKTSKPNPFGAARPREQVIAEREGKKEMEVLKEQASKDWKPQAVLTESQLEEKKAAEAELSFAKVELEKETDAGKLALLTEEVATKERNLEQLIASFEKLASQPVLTGGPKRSHDKNPPPPTYGGESNFGNFRSRGARDGGGPEKSSFSFGESWGGVRKAGGQSECYTCGELGHFSRECQQASTYGGGALGGGRGAGRACYTCGQSGHFSRDCSQGGSYGGGFGGYGSGQTQSASYGGGFGGYGGGQLQGGSYGSGQLKGNSYSYSGGFSGYGAVPGGGNPNTNYSENNSSDYNGYGRR